MRAKVSAAADGTSAVPSPGASVRVRVPAGPVGTAVAVPVSAVRKGPGGDHVFVVAPDEDGKPRARVRQVRSGPVLGDEILLFAGLKTGEKVAALGSFKLRDEVLVAAVEPPPQPRETQPVAAIAD